MERGRGVIALVPEIALTPQTMGRFQSRLGERVALLHSRLSAGQRRDEWTRLRSGEARVAVGPRSAVFAPIEGLGLVIVDEEHEASYKQESDPRYDARDVARHRRARGRGGPGRRDARPRGPRAGSRSTASSCPSAPTAAACPRSRCSTCASAPAAPGRSTRVPARR